ncbi:uncharacterized protein LOC113556892 isoform X1 [Rhopalosiphum maidis]|uniref:uncharacterized protein LOC113556892 isoform X1 n=1 Tax=Rhopalosiphum maidis TaxID=43146 RepID=UPI000EFE391D|nr:uncharacterized protein LOC113556892 isoform X1 [Rhopalosiphum maidis]
MDLLKKYFNDDSLFPFFSDDYVTNYFNYVNEKPIPLVLTPITITLFCYYVYIYVRKFYPIYVNCWFCNANFKVAFEDRFEYSCIECGQFNGFKEDGSYSKSIPEQHDQRYNKAIFSVVQEDVKENKNGLCNKCNIIQEMKVKQLACFIPTKEKYFDREIEKFKENLEATLNLCSKCNQYTQKVLSLQEQRYNLKSTRININHKSMQDADVWLNICSLCLSIIVFVLSSGVEKYLGDWPIQDLNLLISKNSPLTLTRSIGMISLVGTFCQVYHCLTTFDKLSAITMFLWSSLCAINNFDIFVHLKPKLLASAIIVLLSSVSIFRNLTKKQKIEQTRIKLEDEKYKINNTNYFKTSANGSYKNSDESEMMDIDHIEELPKSRKKMLNKTVNNLFRGMKLDENRGVKNNILRPPKFSMPVKRDKFVGYAESSTGYYPSYSVKDDYDFDTQSIYSQHSYRPQCSPLCHQPVSPYTYYALPHHQNSPLNLSHSSNTSSIQHTSEWPKMLMYLIPGVILLALQCYLLHDIKDYMKQK